LGKFQRKKKPNLFWVSAIAPFMVVIIGGIFAFLVKGNEHGIPIVSRPWPESLDVQASERHNFSADPCVTVSVAYLLVYVLVRR